MRNCLNSLVLLLIMLIFISNTIHCLQLSFIRFDSKAYESKPVSRREALIELKGNSTKRGSDSGQSSALNIAAAAEAKNTKWEVTAEAKDEAELRDVFNKEADPLDTQTK